MIASLAAPDNVDEHDREVLVLMMRLGRVLGALDLQSASEITAAVERKHGHEAGLTIVGPQSLTRLN